MHLPADNSHSLESAEPPSAGASQPKGRRVLVVDDNRDAATTMAMLLRVSGHETTLAHVGHEALARLDEAAPHVALLDIGLPGMDGYELAGRIRQLRPEVYLVAVSGYGREEDRERSRAAGFHEHFVKPVDPTQLLAMIAQL